MDVAQFGDILYRIICILTKQRTTGRETITAGGKKIAKMAILLSKLTLK